VVLVAMAMIVVSVAWNCCESTSGESQNAVSAYRRHCSNCVLRLVLFGCLGLRELLLER